MSRERSQWELERAGKSRLYIPEVFHLIPTQNLQLHKNTYMCVGTYCTCRQAFLYMGLWASLTLPPWHYLLSTLSPVWDSCHIVPWARLAFSLQWRQWHCTTFLPSLHLLFSSSSLCQSSQCCQTGSVSELNSRHTWEREGDETNLPDGSVFHFYQYFCLSTLP